MAEGENVTKHIWNGKELTTVGQLSDAVLAIYRSGDQAEADRFMAEYRAINEHGDSNVGYLSGYYAPDTMAGIQRMFGAAHPIFGTRTNVSPEEAFDSGAAMALGFDPKSVLDG